MHPILLKIGPIILYTYGLFVALGLITGLYLIIIQAKKEGISSNLIIDLFFWIVIPGFIGARVFYVFTQWDYFLSHPFRIFFANEGFVFYGGFIFAFLVTLLYTRRTKLETWKIADLIAPSIAIAQAIGRIGCFFFGCCYGKPTNSLIGVKFPPGSPAGQVGVPVIPTQLISSFGLFVIFCILIIIRKHKKFHGQVFWLYVFLYAIARFAIEFFRADERGRILIFSTSQFIAIFMAIIAVAMLLSLRETQ